MPNTTVPIPRGMFIDTKIAFVASVLIRKFTHMGRINSNTKILLALYFARKYAAGISQNYADNRSQKSDENGVSKDHQT
ncbi:MAG: hypothetical protein L6V85_05095 [Clostridiales bacterium]|nr:MAG: hypothetical protein L6V85_05095 [Clostridiales bacterium]